MVVERFVQLDESQERKAQIAIQSITDAAKELDDDARKGLFKYLAAFRGESIEHFKEILFYSDAIDWPIVDEIVESLKDEDVRSEVLRRLNLEGTLKLARKEKISYKEYIAKQSHSFLRVCVIFMTPEQREWLVNAIVFFDSKYHPSVIGDFIKSFQVLDDIKVEQVKECLFNEEYRTELVKILADKGFM